MRIPPDDITTSPHPPLIFFVATLQLPPISRRLNSSGDTFRVLDEGPSPPPPRHCRATTSLPPPLMRIARTFLLSHHITSLSGSIRHWYLALAHNFILFKFRLSILLTNDKMELFCSLVSVACVPLLLLVSCLVPPGEVAASKENKSASDVHHWGEFELTYLHFCVLFDTN